MDGEENPLISKVSTTTNQSFDGKRRNAFKAKIIVCVATLSMLAMIYSRESNGAKSQYVLPGTTTFVEDASEEAGITKMVPLTALAILSLLQFNLIDAYNPGTGVANLRMQNQPNKIPPQQRPKIGGQAIPDNGNIFKGRFY